MTKEQCCIREMYELLDRVSQNAKSHDLSLLRPYRGASGCDSYQGLPPICRILDNILDKYEDVISEAFRASE